MDHIKLESYSKISQWHTTIHNNRKIRQNSEYELFTNINIKSPFMSKVSFFNIVCHFLGKIRCSILHDWKKQWRQNVLMSCRATDLFRLWVIVQPQRLQRQDNTTSAQTWKMVIDETEASWWSWVSDSLFKIRAHVSQYRFYPDLCIKAHK